MKRCLNSFFSTVTLAKARVQLLDTNPQHLNLHNMRDEKQPAVYMTANRYRGTIYVGVTSALWSRIANHKAKTFDGFTAKYGATNLVWYEHYHYMELAIAREKELKFWKRDWKIRIIEGMNPTWLDLHDIIDSNANSVPLQAGPWPTPG